MSELAIVVPAFVAGLLVLATHVPLGRQVLTRGIVFVDLAVAQIAALGVIVAGLLGWEGGLAVQLAAAAAAMLGAALLTWSERRWPDVQEAQIGVVFVLAASGSLLLLAHDPHGGENLRDLLAGQILWVRWPQIGLLAALTLVIGAAWLALRRSRPSRLAFYLVFALAVTASVQIVGVYLVFASLIVPALGARAWPARRQLGVAGAVGIAGYAAGLALSTRWDLPPGALVVWALAAAAAIAHAVAPARARSA